MRRLAAIIACAAFIAMLVPALAYAHEVQSAGDEQNLTAGTGLSAQDVVWYDWGDCRISKTDDGVYTVYPGIAGDYYDAPWYSDKYSAKEIKFVSENGEKVVLPADSRALFGGLIYLESIDLSGIDTSNVENMYYMFAYCNKLTSLDLSMFNTSKVTNMNLMFCGCNHVANFNLSGFDTSNVTTMVEMFEDCYDFKTIDFSSFNTKNVTTMYQMFHNCQSMTECDLSAFDLTSVTTMNDMFDQCWALKTVKFPKSSTPNLKDMHAMFYSCASLQSVDMTSFDTSNVTDMASLFFGCGRLASINVSSFDTRKTEQMSFMFSGCASLTGLDVSSFNTLKVNSMNNMFSGCTRLKELDLSGFNTSNVTSFSYMFTSCESLEKLNLSSFNTSRATDFSSMFCGCNAMKEIDVSSFDVSSARTLGYMFSPMNSLRELDISNFDMTNAEFTSNMITQLPLLERLKVGEGFKNVNGFPSYSYLGRNDWYSKEAETWLMAEDIVPARWGIADTYTKWSNRIQDTEVTVPAQRYTGDPVEPGVTVMVHEQTLVEGVDYEIVGYSNNTEPGTEAVVTLRGIGDFTGEADFYFTISDATPTWTRLSGKSRYATMGLVAKQAFPGICRWAIVVSGADKNFPDALSAAVLAGGRNCPIVTTAPSALSSEAREELERMEVCHVIIVGGTGAVSETVESELNGIVSRYGGDVERIAGKNRYLTSQLVMEAAAKLRAPKTVFISTGSEFADALSAGPWSYKNGAPVVLVNPKTGPTDDQIGAIVETGAEKAVILGGKNAVPETAEANLEAAGLSVERVSGKSRYETSVALARWSMANDSKMAASSPVLATGLKSADALTGASLAAVNNSVIVLADEKGGSARYGDALELLAEEAQQLRDGYFLGGTGAVDQALADRVCDATHAEYREL